MSALPMTAASLEELRFELEQLRRKTSKDVPEEQMVLEARIGALQETLARAVIVDADPSAPDVAGIGSTVTIEDVDSGTRRIYRLVSAHQDVGADGISAASPVGQALIGARAGTVAAAELPNGRFRRVRLVSVEPPANGGA